MRGETTCPECSGPVDDHGYTTADPARLARLEELLERILDLTAEPPIDRRQLAYWRANALAELGGTGGTE